MKHSLKPIFIACVFLILAIPGKSTQLIQPSCLEYRGAFRLPDVAGDCDWTYSGHAMTYYPDGDPGGSGDGYPGSLFATGSDANCQHVSEIGIPAPVISPGKTLGDLNTATILQAFGDIRQGMFGEHQNMTIPRVGLEYLPAQGSQTSGKLYFCWAQHIQDFEVSHGWCELDLSNPDSAGPWKFGNYTNYVTNDYIFEIPSAWADANPATAGKYLATGRAREGPWSGRGPALFAYAPWNDGNPPTGNAVLANITPLLLYGVQEPGTPEISSDASMAMNLWKESDHMYGGAWLTAGSKSSVVFIGTKAIGDSWYGYANGVVWPHGCNEPYCPDLPDPPYDDRGYWAEDYEAHVIFYDPSDLAAVARGQKQTYEPQPYTMLNISQYLFDPEIHVEHYKRDLVGDTCFDRANGYLYVIEKQVDDQKSIIHVWKVNETLKGDVNSDGLLDLKDIIAVLKIVAGLEAPSSIDMDSADINKDGSIGLEEALLIYRKLAGLS